MRRRTAVNRLLKALIDYEEGLQDIEKLELFIIKSGSTIIAEELADLVDRALVDLYEDR